ncbi:MAG: ABC transporter ATP-binding protein [Actinomycetota bacterium]|nr:ABC transporter ATP-binding protein [Actinomycetota bacterium]
MTRRGSSASSAGPHPATWRYLKRFLGARVGATSALVAGSLASGLCMSAVLAILAEIAAALVSRHPTAALHLGPVNVTATISMWTVVGLGTMGLQLLLQVGLAYLPARVMADLQADLRRQLFDAFTTASAAAQSADGEGQFQELATNQVVQVTQGTIQSTAVIINGLMLAVLVAAAFAVGPLTTVLVIVAGIAVFLVLRPVSRLGTRHGRALSEAQFRYAEGVHQAVSLSEEAKVFGVMGEHRRSLGALSDGASRRLLASQFTGRIAASSFQNVVMILVLAGLGILQAAKVADLTSFGVVVLLLVRGSTYAQQMYGSYHWLRQLVPYLDRVDEARRRYAMGTGTRGTARLASIPSLDFERVCFSYTAEVPVLRDVSFRIDPGQATGIVGPTGAGKSTLVQLLLGLRQAGSGRYLVDGRPHTEYSAESWTQAFSYLPQEPRLMRGSVADNIRFFREVDDAAVERAARLAHVHDDIVAWPDGYDTMIGQRADAVSGGQRQRIGLARALVAGPLVLILDEPTSALDNRSELLIQQSLSELRGQMTLVLVAHRLSTLAICDQIIVLQGGAVEAAGSIGEVTQASEYFQQAMAIATATTTTTAPAR